ncbi:MAG: TIGR04282 family arsenosugar biosynthesis glycosyltransferase [Deltaproteobacteria bacterium]|nr:TIGR04282 family arsenosugar biosynthesis glycosyltransferase [Deltaproteobacteria bacterium]
MFANSHIIIFSRYPVPGKTKTRLIPLLGAQKAAQLQRTMTEKITGETLKVTERYSVPFSVFYTDGTREEMTSWLGSSFNYHLQSKGDIGNRMDDAFTRIFADGLTRSVILIGSDIPEITAEIITDGFLSLENNDTVIGPSKDGGYYLIGMKSEDAPQLRKLLFRQMPWSTSAVAKITGERLAKSGYSCSLLPLLHDIDQPEDVYIAAKMNLP